MMFTEPFTHCSLRAERVSREVIRMMRAACRYVDKDIAVASNWFEMVPEIEYTINHSVMNKLALSPIEIAYGMLDTRKRDERYGTTVEKEQLINRANNRSHIDDQVSTKDIQLKKSDVVELKLKKNTVNKAKIGDYCIYYIGDAREGKLLP